MTHCARCSLSLVFVGLAGVLLAADDFRFGQPAQAQREVALYGPDLAALAKPTSSELRELVERFSTDRKSLLTVYSVPGSALQLKRLNEFYQLWQAKIEQMPYEPLGVEGRIDWHLMRLQMRYELGLVAREEKRNAEMAPFMGFAEDIAGLQESRRQFERVKPDEAAATLAKIRLAIEAAQKSLEAGLGGQPAADALKPSKITAYRAANRLGDLTRSLKDWFQFYDNYDPQFGWWVREPCKKLTAALDDYTKFLREKVVGVKAGEDEPIIGDPIGADGLNLDLEHEMMPYTPEQLIAVAEKEFTWCETEWKKVAHDMGFGDDWKAALEKVKHDYVAPGDQPALIARQAYEAIDFVTKRNLITVPPLAIDDWFMTMMSPERQKVNPFFSEGSRSSFRSPRTRWTRRTSSTACAPTTRISVTRPFSTSSFPATTCRLVRRPVQPASRPLLHAVLCRGLGALVGIPPVGSRLPTDARGPGGSALLADPPVRPHHFLVEFHLGKWTPQQCIDFLVEKVGHDRHTATGEVRRSFNGDYSPLYQVGYMMGAIQLRTLYADLVKSGRMKEKDFHDSVMLGGIMPIEMVRAHVMGLKLPRDYTASWKFVGDNP